MTVEAWIVTATIIFLIYSQLATKMPTDVVYLLVLLILLLTGVLDVAGTFAGVIAPATLFLIFMFVVVEAMRRAGILGWMMNSLLGKHKSMSLSLTKIMSLATVMSAFISNPSVAQIMYGAVAEWGRKNHIQPSKLLLPLAYAIGMGGTCTIIGYPINLVLFHILENTTGKEYNIFSPLLLGGICSVVCIIAVVLLQKLLPSCDDPNAKLDHTEEYTTEMLVPSNSKYVGMTVGEAGLDALDCGHIISIVHFDKDIVTPVDKDDFIMGGDRIVFSGNVAKLIEVRDHMGFVNSTTFVTDKKNVSKAKHQLQRLSLTPFNPLVGKAIADTDFEDKHNVSLIALSRRGERLDLLPRNIQLTAGDTLLFEGEKISISPNNIDFIVHDAPIIENVNKHGILSLLALAAVVLFPIFGIMGLVQVSFLMMMVCAYVCCTRQQAWNSINWPIVLVLTGSFAVSVAMQTSGLAKTMSEAISIVAGGSALQMLIVLTVLAILLTQILFDAVVAPILTPIALQSAMSLGIDPFPFVLAVLLGTACNFTTRIATAHMMMVSPFGGYREKDFLRFGIPMCIIMAASIISSIWFIYF